MLCGDNKLEKINFNFNDKKATSWGKVANWYNNLLEEGEDTYQEKLIKPNLLRLLNVKAGEQVLDVGCGQGYFARELAKLGARVLGIDVGNELIKIAKEKSGSNETFLVLSAENMKGIQDNKYDAAICILALQNMKNFALAVSEISRVLKTSGRCLIVLNHPTFRVPGASGWEYNKELNIQYRNVSKYMSEITQEVDMTQGEADLKKKRFTYSFHHPLQVYFKTFAKNNLYVTRLEEWTSHKLSDKGPRKLAEDTARKEIPLFMCIEIKKLK